MDWLRKWLLPLAILALPWQTRFILDVVPYAAGGYQPEWGIYAVYASWILILLAWIIAPGKPHPFFPTWLVISVLITLGFSPYGFQWLAQLGILLLLADAIHRNNWSRAKLATWFVASLIPEAFLALWQYDSQHIFASKWLGISAQIPSDLGVSVVQYGSERILRAYAGFPHPNIAGIWFALGLAAALWLVRHAESKLGSLLGWFMSVILPFALILTFSRSAWLVAGTLLLGHLVLIFKRKPIDMFMLRPMAWTLVCLLLASFLVAPQILSRTSSDNRLETKSIQERTSTWTGIWPLIGGSPLFGHGVGSSVRVMNEAGLGAQPPHAVPLVILLELGAFGLISIASLLFKFWNNTDQLGRWLLVSFMPSALLDHYLYSVWAGISLLILAIIFSLSLDNERKLS